MQPEQALLAKLMASDKVPDEKIPIKLRERRHAAVCVSWKRAYEERAAPLTHGQRRAAAVGAQREGGARLFYAL